jgi:hypothetical protein
VDAELAILMKIQRTEKRIFNEDKAVQAQNRINICTFVE